MYEYKFVRLRLGFFSGRPSQDYRHVIEDHARQGWRLVQVFAPGTGVYGSSKFFELIFERNANLE
jgi:hypothetical protein